jgi:MoaA/NifB/PqqE/SkfB family radical SAM enzyme
MRESQNGDYSFFKQVNLHESFFNVFFPTEVAAQLKIASFSGNIGEPAMNKDLLNILRWFRKQNPNVFLEVYTNGSVQQPQWWIELGNIIGNNGNVIFAIDGLKDTNHIYRVNVKWNKLIQNVKAYISTGATSTWQFIPFKHNQHQVEEAEQMSKDLGFSHFKIKISHRELLNQPQNQINAVEPTDDPRFVHQGQKLDFLNMKKTEDYLDSVDIKCYAIEERNLYISAEGLVFPCCHTASIFLLDDNLLPEGYDWIKNAKKDFDKDEISLYKNKLENILSSNTFNKIKESWSLKMSSGRNPLCAAVCGKCSNKGSLIEGLLGL